MIHDCLSFGGGRRRYHRFRPANTPEAAILLLHGWGQNARGFAEDSGALDLPALVLAPQAARGTLGVADWRDTAEDLALLDAAAAEAGALPLRVWGFSDGALQAHRWLADHVLQPRSPVVVAGAVFASGEFPADVEPLPRAAWPVVVASGDRGFVESWRVGPQLREASDRAAAAYRAAGHPVRRHVEPSGHRWPKRLVPSMFWWDGSACPDLG